MSNGASAAAEGGSRRMFLGLAASAAIAACSRAQATPAYAVEAFASGATLLVAGPQDGAVDRWAQVLAPLLGRTLGPDVALRRDVADGVDGVTGANAFEARVVPDGGTALLAPGDAALAWLSGDPRAHYDVARWVPTLTTVAPAVLVGTIDPGEFLRTDRKLRYAGMAQVGPDLPALLGLDLIGVALSPTFGFADHAAVTSALAQGAFDVACVHGDGLVEKLAAMRQVGARPLLAFGGFDDPGAQLQDPSFADMPTLSERVAAGPVRPLTAAWRAAAVASQIEMVIALQVSAPSAMIARWRRACEQVVATPEMQAEAATRGVRVVGAGSVTRTMTVSLTVDAAAQLALRTWLSDRLNWRPA